MSDESRLRFVSGVNHDLRGYLNGLSGLTWLLESTDLTDEQKQYVASLRHTVDELQSTLGDMVDMARLEVGQLTTVPHPILLEEAIAEIAQFHTLAATSRRLELRTKIENSLGVPVLCDPQRFKQILNGLLALTIKSSSQSMIEIHGFLEPGPTVWLEITDLTNGLSPEMLNRIQYLIETVELPTRYEFGPMGHSLCVSKCILLKLGGQLGVKQTADNQTCIWFSLPVSKVL